MFIDIWDKKNKAIMVNKFSKKLQARNPFIRHKAQDILYDKYPLSLDYYIMTLKNTNIGGFKDTLSFDAIRDCLTFLNSNTFQLLVKSENINYIKITANFEIIFQYDNRE